MQEEEEEEDGGCGGGGGGGGGERGGGAEKAKAGIIFIQRQSMSIHQTQSIHPSILPPIQPSIQHYSFNHLHIQSFIFRDLSINDLFD